MIKLVLSDMDDTLLPVGKRCVSDECAQAIHDLLKAGVLFGPSCGRDYTSVLESFDGDASCMRTALLSSGKKVYVGGRLVDVTYVDTDAVQRLVDVIRPLPGVYVAGRGDDERGFVCGTTVDQLRRCSWGSRRLPELSDTLPSWPLVTVGLYFEEGSEGLDPRQVRAQVLEACPDLDLIDPAGERVYDVVPKGWSKASGLKVLEAKLGLSPEEVLVFGNSDNDLELMREAGISVAVANANQAVKDVAGYHIGSCSDDAVAGALEDIAKTAPWGEKPEFMKREDGKKLNGFGTDEIGSGLEKSETGVGYMVIGALVVALAIASMAGGFVESMRSAITLVLTVLVGVVLFYVGLGRHRDWRADRRERRASRAQQSS